MDQACAGFTGNTSTSPTGPTRSIITASPPSRGCSPSALSAPGGFFPVGRHAGGFAGEVLVSEQRRGRSRDFGCASLGSFFMTRCRAPGAFSMGSAISNVSSPRQLLVLQPVRMIEFCPAFASCPSRNPGNCPRNLSTRLSSSNASMWVGERSRNRYTPGLRIGLPIARRQQADAPDTIGRLPRA